MIGTGWRTVKLKEMNARLLDELNKLHGKGVKITLEGYEVCPARVVDEFIVCEESDYMRDYILDENGRVIELGFYKIKD